jgi:hypothetical protein
MRPLAALALLSACVHAAHTAQPPRAPAATAFPFGVASSDGRLGVMETPDGGLRALNLADGSVGWSSKDAQKPLLVDAGRVIAAARVIEQPNALRLAALDARTGARTFLSDPIVLPPWVIVFGAADGRVRVEAAPADGTVVLDWCARAWYAGGAPPPKVVERDASKSAEGAVRVDLASGRVTPIDGSRARLSCDVPDARPPEAGVPGAVASSRIGGRLYYLVPLPPAGRTAARGRLVAADPATGAVIWEREVEIPTQIRKLPQEIRTPDC